MIRILHVVTYMGRGGLETFLMNYYRHIDRERIQFDFLVHRAARADYDDEIEALGGRIYRIDRLNPFSFSYHKQLRAFFREHPEYKIVHVHQDCLSSIILKAAKQEGVPVRIAHSHSSSQTKDFKYPIKLFFRQFIPQYATHLAACSRAAGDWMFRGAKYMLIRNAIDSRVYEYAPSVRDQVRNELGISPDELTVGHVGRFAEAKNHAFLLRVFDQIQKNHKARLLLVGDGYLRKQIEQQIRELHLEDKVIMTGVQSDVSRYLQAMDVFVFPSIYEGLPVTLVEAQAAGLPCLISDKVPLECKITELVQQYSLNDDASLWAEKAVLAAGTPRQNTIKEIISAEYDVGENSKRLMEFYESLSKNCEAI